MKHREKIKSQEEFSNEKNIIIVDDRKVVYGQRTTFYVLWKKILQLFSYKQND